MKTIEISITMVVFTLFLSCKSSINPTTTLGGGNEGVQSGNQESTQQPESTGEMAQASESTYDTTDPSIAQPSESENIEEAAEQTYDSTDPSVAEPAESENTEEMQYNGSTGANSSSRDLDMSAAPDTDYEHMFTYLEMTDDQIQQFNSAMETYSNNTNSGANSGMDDSIEEKQDDVLSVILTSNQQELYETWKRDN